MASIRPIILANSEIYHIFNRGVEKRNIFTNTKEYKRAVEVMKYYRFMNPFPRYSQFISLNNVRKNDILESLYQRNQIEVQLIAYCFMPNHFHFLLRQEADDGISRFISNFSNSYSKFFNTKHQRIGPLFQGPFKAVRIENNEQLIHVSRYIHLNPVVSYLVKETYLDDYNWSSFPEYINDAQESILDKSIVMSGFQNSDDYRKFVHDQISYARELEKVKHLAFEE